VHTTPANNQVHLVGFCGEGFNAVVKKKQKNKPGDLPNLGKHKISPATLGRKKEPFETPRHIQEI
jgi:hypothetical protein